MKDRWTRGLLVVVAALLLGVWVSKPRLPEVQAASGGSRAQGNPRGFASSVDQRNELLAELKQLNANMRLQLQWLRSGRLKVVVVEMPDVKIQKDK